MINVNTPYTLIVSAVAAFILEAVNFLNIGYIGMNVNVEDEL